MPAEVRPPLLKELPAVAAGDRFPFPILNYYDSSYDCASFMRIIDWMPFVVELDFDGTRFLSRTERGCNKMRPPVCPAEIPAQHARPPGPPPSGPAPGSLLLNALKALGGIDQELDLISTQVLEPICRLKTGSLAVGLQVEGVDHVHIVEIRRGRLVGQVDRVLQGQPPPGRGGGRRGRPPVPWSCRTGG